MSVNSNMIYFDIAATTPLDPRVSDMMNKVNQESFGNPSSIHQFGQKAHNLLEKNRKKSEKPEKKSHHHHKKDPLTLILNVE